MFETEVSELYKGLGDYKPALWSNYSGSKTYIYDQVINLDEDEAAAADKDQRRELRYTEDEVK